MLEVHSIDACYGDYQVLHEVSLQVSEGELVSVFGPNGHGKSTALKTICGLMHPTRGSITYAGQDITRMPIQTIVELGLVYIPEERHVYPDMTVIDNLRMGAYAKRARRRERQNLELVFDLFPRLEERTAQYARTLSGGEAQMLAMGRGLMADARFLAIDEPSLGLAPNLVQQIFQAISRIKEGGVTVLLVEQTVAQACEVSDRIYLVEEGRIVLSCAACDALHDPKVKSTMLGA